MNMRSFSPIAEKGLTEAQQLRRELAKKAGEARFYVTYGYGTNLRDCYSELNAPSIEEARKLVFGVTKGLHAFLYSERDWQTEGGITQAERYGLSLVPLQPQKRAGQYFGRTM